MIPYSAICKDGLSGDPVSVECDANAEWKITGDATCVCADGNEPLSSMPEEYYRGFKVLGVYHDGVNASRWHVGLKDQASIYHRGLPKLVAYWSKHKDKGPYC